LDYRDYRDFKAKKDRRVILQDLRRQLSQDQPSPDPLEITEQKDQAAFLDVQVMLHAAIIFIHRETRQHKKIITNSTRKDLTTVHKYYVHHQQTPAVDVPARSALRASSSGDLVVPPTRRRIGDTAFSVSRHTASMEHAANTAEPAAVDHCFSSPTEDISVPVCLRTPGNRPTIVF